MTNRQESRAAARLIPVMLTLIALMVIATSSGCAKQASDGGKKKAPATQLGGDTRAVATVASTFAEYRRVEVRVDPQVPAYRVNDDLSNVVNAKDFQLSPSARRLLAKNGFVVVPSYGREFYPLYEMNRYNFTPNFVTIDSMLHNYHLFFSHLLKTVEKEKLVGELRALNKDMLAAAIEQHAALKGSAWENAARRNVGFFAVAGKLLDPSVKIPAIVESEVEKELDLIAEHKQMTPSPVMNMGATVSESADVMDREDYTQYIPRGHYETSKPLRSYFTSMMWYGRLTFRASDEDQMRSALLIALALGDPGRERHWNAIYEPTNFFVGKSDDITYYQLRDVLAEVYGARSDLAAVTGGDDAKERFGAFVKAVRELEPPQINSIPVFADINPEERQQKAQGFRFMGQRYTIDADIFQRLVHSETRQRMLPKGLDIPAAMGSDEALNILDSMGETRYVNYMKNMNKLRARIGGLDTRAWTQNLYWCWMYSLLSLVGEKPEGYPAFMQNLAWERKELQTYAGSWTELKHDTILYAKQVYAEAGGDVPAKKDDRGYVEPNPQLYARLASLLAMTREGLEVRGLLEARDTESLERMEKLALSFKTISEKELENKPLSAAEYELIRGYGAQLEHFWIEALRSSDIKSGATLDNSPAALVADVATNPGASTVLEEATGHVFDIYVVVPVDGALRITAGGVFSYYEFPWPAQDRLTDAKWRDMLEKSTYAGEAIPAQPAWTRSFIEEPRQ